MTVRRIMGSEIEYGISVVGDPFANPMFASTALINAYRAASHQVGNRWDYAEESPLRDARGFDLARRYADPSQLTDEDIGMANLILTNGARLYVDHAHPEYSSPEVTTPRDLVRWEKAGDQIMLLAAHTLTHISDHPGILLYKNNTDGKGASYGAHENYLVRRTTPFADLVVGLTPFFVSRQVLCGAGRVGKGQTSEDAGFQLSQRADFFETEIGLETTMRRPIINTRDEPHADPELWRRLHVIVGDANLSETALLLKVGSTSLVLAMIESGWPLPDLRLAHPVAAMHEISHDPTLKTCVERNNGSTITGLELQEAYLEAAQGFVRAQGSDAATHEVLDIWGHLLKTLRRDPLEAAEELDWVAKWKLMSGFVDRDGLSWSDAKLALIDLQYADLRPERGLYYRLVSSGRMKTLCDPTNVASAVSQPPEDTRAYFRGECVRRFSENVVAASWDSVIFDLGQPSSLQRVPTLDPLRGTKQQVAQLLADSETVEELLAALAH
jgi:Pup amidohydrolase